MSELTCFIDTHVREVDQNVWGAVPVLQRGMLRNPDRLLSPQDIDRILNGASAPEQPFYLVRNQEMPDPTEYPTRGAVDRLMRDGYTAVMPALQRHTPAIADLCADVMARSAVPSFGGAYMTPPKSQGFKLHWDLGSVTVLQIEGSKKWTLARPVITDEAELAIPWSVRGFSDEEQARPPYRVVTLRKGDVLFIPRAWVHAAQATNEASVHVSIGALHEGIDLDSCSTVFP
jgi:cupin superfamily protein